jgi:hypothetical protein
MPVSKTVSVDSLQLIDMYVIQASPGVYTVKAVYSLLTGGQVVLTCNQDVTSAVAGGTSNVLGGAFSAVSSALASQWTS